MRTLAEIRSTAKLFGGFALTGGKTQKMKLAAELERERVLKYITDGNTAIYLCDPSGLAATCQFWLVNRGKLPEEFEQFILKQKQLLNQFRDGDKSVAFEYNALTKQWGFD